MWAKIKSFAATMHGKQTLVAVGLVVIAAIIVAGIQLYIHLHAQVSDPMVSSSSSEVMKSVESSSSISSSSTLSSSTPTSSGTSLTPVVDVQSVTLNKSSMSLVKGQTSHLSVSINPEAATDKSISWSSDDKYTASVNSDGIVTAESAGTATIYAKASNGASAKCKVTVTSPSASTGNSGNTGGGGSAGEGSSTGGSPGGGGSTGGGSSNDDGSTGGSSSSAKPSGNNLAGLATYGDYPYPYGVEATHAQFVEKSPQNDCNKIASDLIAEYKSEEYTFDTCAGNVYVSDTNVIRGYLSGHGQSHVVDIAWNFNGSSYYHWNLVILS